MRVATYNVWNSTANWEQRLAAIVEELGVLGADIVALQEAPTEAFPGRALAAYLEVETGYRHVLHLPYDVEPDDTERPEGLALLSRWPVRGVWTNWSGGATTYNNAAARFHVEVADRRMGITNIHLDWQDQSRRVEAMADIVDRLIAPHPADVEILCGDFNDHEGGPVAVFLEGHAEGGEGQPEAAGARARWRWLDAVASSVGPAAAPITLDFLENPRWAGGEVSERPGRFDRIYLRDTVPARTVMASGLFGRRPANRFGIIPSDHYGVFVDLAL